MNRTDIATLIERRLAEEAPKLTEFYATSGPIPYFVIDNLLPEELALQAASLFPAATEMKYKHTLRERKYVSSQMNRHAGLVEELLFAFQDARVLARIQAIVRHSPLYADPNLYAGGISRMEEGGYLNPHIDNSHDMQRAHWRSLNLLYYLSPGWRAANGGNLELWPNGVKDAPVMVESRFNRLVVMATHHHSLHSVSPIRAAKSRLCISNYYFSDSPMHPGQPFHVTSFRGRPEQCATDLMLRADALLRQGLRALKRGGFFNTGHWYRK